MTGNSRRFSEKLGKELDIPIFDIRNSYSPFPAESCILVTHTIRNGEIPTPTEEFLEKYSYLVKGVCVSGSYHWGANYGRAGVLILERYGTPYILRFNKSGNENDVIFAAKEIKRISEEAWISG